MFPCPHCDLDTEAGDACARCKGALVVDGWRIERSLGKGGSGHVYEARDAAGARAAVKSMPLAERLDPKALELFDHGSRVLKSLTHPRVPRVHAFVHDERGRMFLVREVLDGGTLAERIAAEANRVTPELFEKILVDLLELLVDLHGRVPPIVHRDIKPANIMFRTRDDWDAVLVDFDSVALPEAQRSGLTIVGTPGYCAPEQFAGIVSPAADLYSLGATMLFVATHTEPDRLPRVDGRFDVSGGQLDALRPRVRRALLHLVEPERSTRTHTAEEALRELREPEAEPVIEPERVLVHAPPALPRHPVVKQREEVNASGCLVWAGIGLLVVLVIAAVAASTDHHHDDSFHDTVCTVNSDPPGAEIYRVGEHDDFMSRELRNRTEDAGIGNVFPPMKVHDLVGKTPLELHRQSEIMDGVVLSGTYLQAELPGYQPAIVPSPFDGITKCRPVTVKLSR
jgi:serine/threonine protein kinase